MSIAENVYKVRERIRQSAQRSGRQETDITLIAVTKTHPPAVVEEVIRCGIGNIGENRVQEAVEKYARVREKAVWHMVGHLQRNKAKTALEIFSVVHSVDSLELADLLNKYTHGVMDIFVEINIGEEAVKSGIKPDETFSFLGGLRQFPNLHCRGLMVIPPFLANLEDVRPYFRTTTELLKEANRLNILEYPLQDLSMGMTDDFEVAIEEGATVVRIGRALFGEREY